MRVIAGETTFGDLEERLEYACQGLALYMLNDIMDQIEEETGSRPGWNDPAPQDVLDVFYLSGPNDIYGIESQPGDPGYSWLS